MQGDITGIISDFVYDLHCYVHYAYFRLKLSEKGDWEFAQSNQVLTDISDTPVGKQKVGLLLNDDIYYDKYILIEDSSDIVKEFDEKEELQKYLYFR